MGKKIHFNSELIISRLLKGRGLYAKRFGLQDSIHLVVESDIEARTRRRTERRTYNVKDSNHLWHIATTRKLIRWSIIIFGATDGFNRLAVCLECIDNGLSKYNIAMVFEGC